MKYAVEMVSGDMIYIHNKFCKDLFRQSKVVRGGIHT
jgi:hypothetical protein